MYNTYRILLILHYLLEPFFNHIFCTSHLWEKLIDLYFIRWSPQLLQSFTQHVGILLMFFKSCVLF